MLNVVAIVGRLVADPELRTTQTGHSVCSLRIACDRSYVQQGQQRQADFIDVIAWRQSAEFVSKNFKKGSLIAVEGRLQTRQYQDKQGNNRTAVEVVANNISFAGTKRQDSQSAPSYEQQTASHVEQAKAQTRFAQGSADDFAVIDDNDDLPF
mgnify:CR=1 FL=1